MQWTVSFWCRSRSSDTDDSHACNSFPGTHIHFHDSFIGWIGTGKSWMKYIDSSLPFSKMVYSAVMLCFSRLMHFLLFAFAFVLPSVAGCLCQQHVNWMSATGKMTDNGSLDISSSAGRALVQSLNRAGFTPNDNILTAFKSNQCHECQNCKDNGHSKS